MKKILLTGGHAATTAISVVEELIRRNQKNNLEIDWIGAKSSLEGRKRSGLEVNVFPNMGVNIHLIDAGRLQRKFTRYTLFSILKLPIGFIQSFYFVAKIKPDLVLSFGGFASFPVVFAAYLFNIPVLVHEQTTSMGLANKISAFFTKEVLLARKESLNHFNHNKVQVVGNPIMTQILEVPVKEKIGNLPKVLVMGGSRGSRWINDAILEKLDEILKKYSLIHLTGEEDFNRFKDIKKTNYQVFSWVDPLKIDGLYREADIVIARSGANTVSELQVVKRPAILIPIPWSHLNEQEENAKKLVDIGLARIIKQKELSGVRLLKELDLVVKNYLSIISKVKDIKSPDYEASSKVTDIIEKYLK